MDVDSSTSWIVVAVVLVLQATISAGRSALLNVRRSQLRVWQEESPALVSQIERIMENPARMQASSQSAMAFLYIIASSFALSGFTPPLDAQLSTVSWLAPASPWLAPLLVILILGTGLFLLGQWLPAVIAARHNETFARPAVQVMQVLRWVCAPFVLLADGVAGMVARASGEGPEEDAPAQFEEEIKTLVDAFEGEGVIEEDEKEMIFSIFELGETLVREVMVPRIDIVAVEVNTPLLMALDVMMGAGYSRIPVYEETIDNIIGILYLKDILSYFRNNRTDVPLREVVREPYFVPETKKVDQLLPELKQRKVHMAIVVDEYGGTAGLVTIEDILEEIVGEIQDEHDVEEPIYEIISEDEYILNARINLDDFAKLLGVELQDEGSDTLGGFIYNRLGRVPSVGDRVEYDGIQITVLTVAGRRIGKVRVTRHRPARSPEAWEAKEPSPSTSSLEEA